LVIKDMGRKGPVLAEPVQAKLTLKRRNGARLRVFALNTLTGERKQELNAQAAADGATFDIGRDHGAIYYEITSED